MPSKLPVVYNKPHQRQKSDTEKLRRKSLSFSIWGREFHSFGFLRYWQRQGFCSLILLQHRLVGGVEDVIALTQELSCAGLHVTASTLTCSLARSSTKRVQTTIQDVLIFT
ncbi:hypothetical protein NC651_028454 [Populus alba x Populus x berolinensis]|nr:hypothetical protein NC651_028448 [Populus alba x Populus x berolinensis]KAJ6881852.1 hypothetical protein NC651_028454 [Populus alba x Populus x berolinensis]